MNATIGQMGLIVGAAFLCGPLCAQETKPAAVDDTRAYFEELRSQFNTNKIHVYNDAMKLTAAESEKFWPIYREYEKELAAVGDRKLELIREFFRYYQDNTLTDAQSKVIAEKWLRNAQERLDLWKKYYSRFSKALSPTRAGQFLQLEHQISLFVDLAIASEMPALTPGGPGVSGK